MPVSVFSQCTESCGWIAAVVSALAFGTYGVPLKTSAPPGIEVHPLVMQSYKTITCFCTCWLVLLAGEELRFTPWGIASGLFWVPGAACGIYGIRNAGLAVAVGTWSSITVLTSFVFGVIIFQEKVRSLPFTMCAFTMLICGLVGMSKYSSSSGGAPSSTIGSGGGIAPLRRSLSGMRGAPVSPFTSPKRQTMTNKATLSADVVNGISDLSSSSHGAKNKMQSLEMEPMLAMSDEDAIMKGSHYDDKIKHKDMFHLCGMVLTRRQTGILGAVVNGVWGGMNLIPLHYAMQEGLTGAGYLISYGVGSAIVNTVIWIVLLFYELVQSNFSWNDAVEALPKFHLKHLWFPGIMAGTLYSLGNFASILAVTYLGQGTGFSFCMMQLFVSGLWGVFYFHEIRGPETITKWFLSAVVAVTGIIWLSYEHEGESVGHR